MVIKIKKPVAVMLGILLIVLGAAFLLYGILEMDPDEKINMRQTSADLQPDIDPALPMVALTYDDGPYTPVTGRILDSLKAAGGRATFFIVGNRIAGREEVVRKIAEYGSEIGNHTYEHAILTSMSQKSALAQLQNTEAAISAVTGAETNVIRPPCGCYNSGILEAVNKPMVLWTLDTRDWSHQNRDKTVAYVLENIKDGDIVLMHDLFVPTAEASEILIPELVKRGFQLVTVSELIQYREEPNGIVLHKG